MKTRIAIGVAAVACAVAGTPCNGEATPRRRPPIGLGVEAGIAGIAPVPKLGLVGSVMLYLHPAFSAGLVGGVMTTTRERETTHWTAVMARLMARLPWWVVQPFVAVEVGWMGYASGDYIGTPLRYVVMEEGGGVAYGGVLGVDVVPRPWIAFGVAGRVWEPAQIRSRIIHLTTRVEVRF